MKTKKTIIQIGYRVGQLTVIEPTDARKNGYTVWKCLCDCGKEVLLDTRYLQRGTITDCGCSTNISPYQKDLTGKRFGRLVCITPTDQRSSSGCTIWRCKCDCGNECLASSRQLNVGYKKSCGCLSHPPLKNYEGTRFGRLTVTAYAGKRAGMHHWRCICDCGKETVVGQTLLQNGKTKSCGCLQSQILRENRKLIDGTSVAILEARQHRLLKSNTSGHNGVYQNKKNGKWRAQITFRGKTYFLGEYLTLQEAIRARKRGEEMHLDFLEWYYREKEVGNI